MKFTKYLVLPALMLLLFASAFDSATVASDKSRQADPSNVPTVLPDQQNKGLLVSATFNELRPSIIYSHNLDLRVTNREGAPKMNLTVEEIRLGAFETYFVPPLTATLWARGSSAHYPAIASWRLPTGMRARLPLYVTIRYEDSTGKETIARFEWEVSIDGSNPVSR